MSCPEVTQSPRVAHERTAGAAHRAAVLTDVILAHINALIVQAVRCGSDDTSELEDLARLIEVLQGVMTAAVEETWGEDA